MMIRQIAFTKMVASGNDFVVVDQRRRITLAKPGLFAAKSCDRRYGAGADGLLVLEKSKRADMRMRIFNPDGSEPAMCGNGIRCAAFFAAYAPSGRIHPKVKQIKIETKAGIIWAVVDKGGIKIKMTSPKGIKLNLPIKINQRKLNLNFINSGVPHAVIFVEGLDKIDIVNIGRQIRFHKRFLPAGTNVDFVQIIDDNNIKLRTYERGVEDETLACGTGTVAAAIISVIHNPQLDFNLDKNMKSNQLSVETRSGEILSVEVDRIKNKFKNIWLKGKAQIVYSGFYPNRDYI
ncbi:MAG: diaminopimelate epimerase [Candidatus Omnitrophota bacterium]